jgi:hypothetical protein
MLHDLEIGNSIHLCKAIYLSFVVVGFVVGEPDPVVDSVPAVGSLSSNTHLRRTLVHE